MQSTLHWHLISARTVPPDRLRSRLSCFRTLTIVVSLALTAPVRVPAQDAPHSRADNLTCTTCHLDHDVFGNQIGTTAGNANVCLSCHQVGGLASGQALAESQQASLWPAAAAQPQPTGRSHRWDAGPAGQVESLSAVPAGALEPSGVYTGRYAVSYTVTITTPGNSGTARFNWSGSGPGTGSGTGVMTGNEVALEAGLKLSFRDAARGSAFAAGDQWRLKVRPGLQLPANSDMLRTLAEGKVVCATCHDPHFQSAEPFDPNAPAYDSSDGNGRHFMRAANDQDQMCAECHASRIATNALAGHPTGVLVSSNALVHPPGSLPLDKHEGKMWCSTCHQVHNAPSNDGHLLRTAHEKELCLTCHALADTSTPASHFAAVNGMLWPGGQYGSLLPADSNATHRGSCGSCHRVHGWPDPANVSSNYPSLLVEREENLCYTCHDGSPVAKNLRANFTKTYRHPVATYTGRHTASEEGDPARYGTANRHAECADCHNPHQLAADTTTPVPPTASRALRGVARVSVNNVSSNSVAYTFRGPSDPTPVKEYEVCFTCHSGWSTRPAGQADYAAKFNTKIASFHPVESVGKNLNINVNAFTNGWRATATMFCTDCHTSDDPGIRGPHGSTNQYILKKRSIASPARRTTAMASTELCFDCHRYDTYGNNSASSTVKNYSRFGSNDGHAYHVGRRRYPCYACHETHGAASRPNLLVTGRSPGITTYTRTATGGTCIATCHGNESYTVAYPR